MSLPGPKQPISDVHFSAALRGRADIREIAEQFGSISTRPRQPRFHKWIVAILGRIPHTVWSFALAKASFRWGTFKA